MAKGVRLKNGMASGDKQNIKNTQQNYRITFHFVTFSYCLYYICNYKKQKAHPIFGVTLYLICTNCRRLWRPRHSLSKQAVQIINNRKTQTNCTGGCVKIQITRAESPIFSIAQGNALGKKIYRNYRPVLL